MNGNLVGYARCSTDGQDVTAQREALMGFGVPAARIYVDHGLSGTNRDRPALREAMAACWEGTTLVVTKLDRLARSLADATAIAAELTERGAKLSLGGTVHDPQDPVGRLLFNVLGMVAEFEADLISQRTKEGMRVARAKGRLQGRPPKLTPMRERLLVEMRSQVNEDGTSKYTVGELAELFDVGRATVYRALERALPSGQRRSRQGLK
ncbi:recombinase family protein [Curtobacterium flaccumfaciens]|uniref:recombinase family protein n=1 Tax=Curtobacterium flaccumfaciens TaxID=2035 RepID=UPI001E2A2FA6|nr:recombinase family protein [Curtobacterium allii]MCE0459538.1 recombinase family protein [Curtobacterium allii]